jgi:glycosyltransferase involved in cell wall biosynthesis
MTPRVVILTTYFRPVVGGVESNAERFARFLHARRFEVQVVTKRITSVLPDRDTLEGVPIERIGPFGERSASGKWRLAMPAFHWLLTNRSRYDVVCCIDYRGVGVSALAARAVTGHRVLLQAQTPGNLLDPSLLARPFVAVYRHADAFACISHALEKEAIIAGVPAERVHFLPNPVDMTRFRPAEASERDSLREKLGLPVDSVLCLFVGRLSREKGVMDLMTAWREVRSPHGILLVAGPDMTNHPWDEGYAAREFAERHHLGPSVRFLGSIDDVAPLLRTADIVVQPSHFEAQGLSAVEALASGVPVIASAVGGLLDFIRDGDNGMLCPPQNPAALATAIRTLVDDSGLRHRLTSRTRRSVADKYDAQKVFGRFADLLSQLASRPS